MLALKQHISTAFVTASQQPIPTVLTDMISDYAQFDYSIALERPDTNKLGLLSRTQKNERIMEAIYKALSSAECDPRIKHKIFALGSLNDSPTRYALEQVVSRLQADRIQINLDNTDLSGCNLSQFDLSGMTAKGASFALTSMIFTLLVGADLTGATFFETYICRAELIDATLKDTHWTRSAITESDLTRVDLSGAKVNQLIFAEVNVSKAHSSDPAFREVINRIEHRSVSIFDRQISGTYSSGSGFTRYPSKELWSATYGIRTKCYNTYTSYDDI